MKRFTFKLNKGSNKCEDEFFASIIGQCYDKLDQDDRFKGGYNVNFVRSSSNRIDIVATPKELNVGKKAIISANENGQGGYVVKIVNRNS